MDFDELMNITLIGSANELGLKYRNFNDPNILFVIANSKNWNVASVEKMIYCLFASHKLESNYQNEQGNTFFHELVLNRRSSKDITRLLNDFCLIDPDFDVNMQNLNGDTFLHLMLKSDMMYIANLDSILEFVIAKGFNSNIKNNRKETVFDCIHDLQDTILCNTIEASRSLANAKKKRNKISMPEFECEIDDTEVEMYNFLELVKESREKAKKR